MKKSIGNILEHILTWLAIVLLVAILFVNMVIIVDTILHPSEVPSFFGYIPFVSGADGEYGLELNDLVIILEVDPSTLNEGDYIAYLNYDRVMMFGEIGSIDGEEIVTTASDIITFSDVEGIIYYSIPYLGYIFVFLANEIVRTVVQILLIIFVIYLVIDMIREYRRIRLEETQTIEVPVVTVVEEPAPTPIIKYRLRARVIETSKVEDLDKYRTIGKLKVVNNCDDRKYRRLLKICSK